MLHAERRFTDKKFVDKKVAVFLLLLASVALGVIVIDAAIARFSTPEWKAPTHRDALSLTESGDSNRDGESQQDGAPRRGGSVRVAVMTAPNLHDEGDGGAAVRSLIAPSLFSRLPSGKWAASLVEPGSDRVASDERVVSFVLRKDTTWSDGTPIGVSDLRRTANDRYVERIEDADATGRIHVRLRHVCTDWRSLWSDDTPITPRDISLSGGPFVLKQFEPDAISIFVRNNKWFGISRDAASTSLATQERGAQAHAPYLDEVQLARVASATTQRQLLRRGEVDVIVPPLDSERAANLRALPSVQVLTAPKSGVWTALILHPNHVADEWRNYFVAQFSQGNLFHALTPNDADALDSIRLAGTNEKGSKHTRNDAMTTVSPSASTSGALLNSRYTITVPSDEPLGGEIAKAVQFAAKEKGSDLQIRNVSSAEVATLVRQGTYDIAMYQSIAAAQPCYSCVFGPTGRVSGVEEGESEKGDSAAAARIEQRLARDAVLIPLWREHVVVAMSVYGANGVQGALKNVQPNGLVTAHATWNCASWWRSS